MLRLHVKPDAPPLLRNYSMSGPPGGNTYRVSVKQEVNGAASSYLHHHVNAGDTLEVSAPRGAFTLHSGDAPVVLASAGIGATPVLAMLHALAAQRSSRPVWWLYGARNRSRTSFCTGIARTFTRARPRSKAMWCIASPLRTISSAAIMIQPDTSTSLCSNVSAWIATPSSTCCGPPPFLRGFTAGLKTWGADSSRIYAEIFGPEESITPGIAPTSGSVPHVPAGPPGHGPQISFTRSGVTAPWDSRFSSLLDFAEACDVPVRWSCRTGVCHTCESALIGGAVDYRPDPLEPPAQGNILICCSQPRGDVEIDL